MPNYVINKLVIIGNEANKIADEILSIDEDGRKYMDFNNIVKMPEELNIVCGSPTKPAADYYLASINPRHPEIAGDKMTEEEFDDFIKKVNDTHGEENLYGENKYDVTEKDFAKWDGGRDAFLKYGKNVAENRAKYHASTWYEWSNSNWGTKWNASESRVDVKFRYAEIWFETPWCKPTPLLQKMFDKYEDADATFVFDWSEEQIGIDEGHIVVEKGHCLECELFDECSVKKAEKHGHEMWGY